MVAIVSSSIETSFLALDHSTMSHGIQLRGDFLDHVTVQVPTQSPSAYRLDSTPSPN